MWTWKWAGLQRPDTLCSSEYLTFCKVQNHTDEKDWHLSGSGREGETGGTQGTLGSCSYSVWHENSGYMSLYSCPNLNRTTRRVTLM